MTTKISKAKLEQAAALMPQHGLDCWIVSFARETGNRQEPLEYLIGSTITWPSAFLLHRDGRTVAIVGSGDVGHVRDRGIWSEVRGYVASPREELVKLPDEVEAIHSAIAATEDLFKRIETILRPGITEKEVQEQVHRWVREAGLGFSWEDDMNPIVDFGPLRAPMGHSYPGDTALAPGHLIHVDVGLRRDGYASDLQRTWYWLRDGETEAPEAVRKAFEATRAALDAGMAALRPGQAGHQVDAASRATVIE